MSASGPVMGCSEVQACATWLSVALKDLAQAGPGWRHDDPVMALKLEASVRRHGQLRPLVVGTLPDGRLALLDGRRLAAAMRECGYGVAMAVDVGPVDAARATALALALEVAFDTDYARLAVDVAALLDGGATPEAVSACSPFDAERVRYFGTLARFDWSQFKPVESGQSEIAWDLPDEPVASAPVVAERVHPIAPVPERETLEAEVEAEVELSAVALPDVGPDGQASLF